MGDFDFDVESISLHGFAEDMEAEPEEEEEMDSDIETDYGSVDVVNEDETVFDTLEQAEYDDYRFIMLSESKGVEHYIVKKLFYLRSLPVARDIWVAIQELFAIHETVQLGGIETRKRAMNFLMARRRYQFWYEKGRIPPGESQKAGCLMSG